MPTARLELRPLGRTLHVERGSSLQDALFDAGVEFPCGGHARCRGCRVRLVAGSLPISPEEHRLLSHAELEAGWRLACRARADSDLTLELAAWEPTILGDAAPLAVPHRDGLGIAVDLGTTTIVAQLVDLRTREVLNVRTALNAQSKHGADIMSRIEFATTGHGGERLTHLIRAQLGELLTDLLSPAASAAPRADIAGITVVGNTVMHHLFAGLDVTPLAAVPFEPRDTHTQTFPASALGWQIPGDPLVRFLPCLGGFVGSDILAGILATGLHDSPQLGALVDLGTNGEIVVGNRDRLLCTSTAAGPAFEGARLSQGMRADRGAIAGVTIVEGRPHCRVLGGDPARGICGSGIVDAVATGLDLGVVGPTGRLTSGREWELAPGIHIRQSDIRELQLAKGAVAAGLRLLLETWGATAQDLTQLHLAGAFGNYVDRTSAHRIGLLPLPAERTSPAGNTALHGAKLALFEMGDPDAVYASLQARVRHVSLGDDPRFGEIFAEEMLFPEELRLAPACRSEVSCTAKST